MLTAIAITVTVVLLSRVLSADAETDASVTVIVYAFPVSVSPARVAISPSEIAAVITPVVWAARVLAWATVNSPPIVHASFPSPKIVPFAPAAYTVLTSANVPLIVVEVTVIGTVVLVFRVLSAAAVTNASVTVTVYALPVSLSPARIAVSPSEIVAVTTPVVKAEMTLAWATVMLSEIVIASFPRPVMVPAALEV